MRPISWFVLVAGALISASPIGVFENHNDVGVVLNSGSAEYDAASKTYTLVGSGENMWFGKDEFHFVWKKVSSVDFTLTADIAFPETGGNAHKKAVLMARQSLDTDSAYADVAVHGDGLTSLQSREETGANTHEVGINAAHPQSARLEKRGDYFYMSLAGSTQSLEFSGASMKVKLKVPFYVGIGICSHDKDAVAKAVFSNLTLLEDKTPKPGKTQHYSTTESISVKSTDRRVVHVEPGPAGPGPTNGTEAYPAVDDFVNCFPRTSPDGSQVAVLSYDHGTAGCPADQEVLLRLISTADKSARVLARFKGGPGTLGDTPWSTDGKSLTFVTYQEITQ